MKPRLIRPNIVQVIGCAHTYRVSEAVRKAKSDSRPEHSSKQANTFSYFKKVEKPEDIVKDRRKITLTLDPETGELANHWHEPELAILLGERHKMVAFAIANDFTASSIELKRLESVGDPTYLGKCWPGSCAIGGFIGELPGDIHNLRIRLQIIRKSKQLCDRSYSTEKALRRFEDMARMIVERRKRILDEKGALPQSKQIIVDGNFLPEGTVILTGTGLITQPEAYAKVGDLVMISSDGFPSLRNVVGMNNLDKLHKK